MEIPKWSIFCYNMWSFVLSSWNEGEMGVFCYSQALFNHTFVYVPEESPQVRNQPRELWVSSSLSTLSHTSPLSTSNEGKEAGNWVWSPVGNDLINCPYVVKPPKKNSKGRGLEGFQVINMQGEWLTPASRRQGFWAWGPSGAHPVCLSIELCIHILHCVLYNKPINVICALSFMSHSSKLSKPRKEPQFTASQWEAQVTTWDL